MAKHVPFAYGAKDGEMVTAYYSDSEIVRVSLETADKVLSTLPPKMGVWLDAAADGFEHWPSISDGWKRHMERFAGWRSIGDAAFQQRPDAKIANKFVGEVLDACMNVTPKPLWLSVPQLPTVSDASRNKINRALAAATGAWRARKRFHGKLILPVILTHQEQANLKVNRNQRIRLAGQCFESAGADGYWVVEASLSDQSGAGTFERKRFPSLISFHEEIAEKLGIDGPSVAGPYWALNLVLWARGLVGYPAIGLGIGYQYHVPGGPAPRAAKKRIALPPLRRWATVGPKLDSWLADVPKTDAAYSELLDLRGSSRFALESTARKQVARFYKSWYDKIASVTEPGQALALYQDFSTAYVLGKPLPDLPDDEGTARRPERIAEQFMLQCL
jgi:hypothetical protein